MHPSGGAAPDVKPAPITRESLREAAGLFAYLLPYKFRFGLALVCLLLANAMGLAFPFITGRLIDNAHLGFLGSAAQSDAAHASAPQAAGPAAPAGATGAMHGGASGNMAGSTNGGVAVAINAPQPIIQSLASRFNLPLSVDGAALLLICVLAVQALCTFFETYLLAEVGQRSVADLRRDTYARLIRLPMAFFSERRVGELASRLANDVSQIQGTLTGAIPQALSQVVTLVGGIALITITSGKLTLVMLASVPVIIAAAVVFGRATRKVSKEAQDKLAGANVIVEETLQGIAVVKAFTNEKFETQRYQSGIAAFVSTALRGALYQGTFSAFITLAGFGSIVLVLWYGAHLVADGQLTFGGLTQFMIYTMFIAGAIGHSARTYSELQRLLGATHRVRELLREPAEDVDARTVAAAGDKALPAASENGDSRAAPRLAGDVVFHNVSFAYPSRKEVTVLRNLSLAARSGQRIALVGPSGAGKSTIVSLLLRYYDPDEGQLLIDGRDAREYPLHVLRSRMAIVPQDVLLFGGTIAENIAYGRPGASREEIVAAAEKANAHEFIAGFPEGYETIVGERGVKLSGGQRQRVAIARAILRDPAILVLDEATSSLDSESESLVQQALEVLMQGRTSLIIAHRLSTVRKADCIYCIKQGEVVEAGTHEELLAQPNGLYRTLSELQFDLAERV